MIPVRDYIARASFATRFLRSHIVVLLADLLEACGETDSARDMIIGHELGHIRAGHLRGHWLLLPATFVPCLGSQISFQFDSSHASTAIGASATNVSAITQTITKM